jgi:hypothetical protein
VGVEVVARDRVRIWYDVEGDYLWRPHMPTVADVEILAKTLGNILTGKPQTHGALTVIPILASMQAEPEWLTLAEAGDSVRITEVDQEGSVPDLRVANLGGLAPAAPGRRAACGRQAEPHPQYDRADGGPDRGDHPRELRGAGAVGGTGPGTRRPATSPCTPGCARRSARGSAARFATSAATRPISWTSGRPSPSRRRS